MGTIPKIIHQTWKDTNIPAHLSPLAETWKSNHPDWEYILWTDEANESFIKKYHPDFLSVYQSLPHAIQRVDLVRYFILYEFGGVFIDLDFECLINISPLLINEQCVLGIEPEQHCERHQKELIVCNAFMACCAQNDFFKSICNEFKTTIYTAAHKYAWLEILESTGPFKLTRIYNAYNNKHAVKLLSSDLIYPLSLDETRELINNEKTVSKEIQKKIKRAYAVHYFLGSWW
ncbi:MAG TPA: glycosyltransferase [Mucilaginibacter sp.]|jgi:mannosyltransferase OCH1-like enzyme|nr:glycosyltransferase [Mucilaginibacter sp.]